MKYLIILTLLIVGTSVAKADTTCPVADSTDKTAESQRDAGETAAALNTFNAAITNRLSCNNGLSGSDLYDSQLMLAGEYVAVGNLAKALGESQNAETDYGYARTVIGWLQADTLQPYQSEILGEVVDRLNVNDPQ
jgi:hypothetical protein